MSSDQNKMLVHRFYEEVWMKGNLAVADEVFAANPIRHDPALPTTESSPDQQKQNAASFRGGFPDFQMTIDLMAAEANLVIARWTIRGTHAGQWSRVPVPPTGKKIAFSGVNIFRLESGKIVEIWNHRDDLSLMQQLG